MEGTIVNQVEISGFDSDKDAEKFRKKIKTLNSVFSLFKIDKAIDFSAEEASWKNKEKHTIVYLFLTEDSSPEKELLEVTRLKRSLLIKHLMISPSGGGKLIFRSYSDGHQVEQNSLEGPAVQMLGDLIKGGFK